MKTSQLIQFVLECASGENTPKKYPINFVYKSDETKRIVFCVFTLEVFVFVGFAFWEIGCDLIYKQNLFTPIWLRMNEEILSIVEFVDAIAFCWWWCSHWNRIMEFKIKMINSAFASFCSKRALTDPSPLLKINSVGDCDAIAMASVDISDLNIEDGEWQIKIKL